MKRTGGCEAQTPVRSDNGGFVMTDSIIHIHKAGAMNSDTVCGKRFMSLKAQDTRMTYQVHKATCPACVTGVPAKFR